MIRPATSLFALVMLLLSVCPAIAAQSVGGLGVLEPLPDDALSLRPSIGDPAPGLNPYVLPSDVELSTARPGDLSVGEDSARSFWTRVLVSGAVGGLAGYVLGGWIDGRGDCVWPDESRCTNANADQQGFVVGTSVGVLVSGILHFW